MVKFAHGSFTFKNKFIIRTLIFVSCLSFCIACPFDCAEEGCCYSRADDIVCRYWQSSNVFNVSTIMLTAKLTEKAISLTYCGSFLCYLTASDLQNQCISTDLKRTHKIDFPSGATGLVRKGHTHFIDYPRILYLLHHKAATATATINYSLVKLPEDISFTSNMNNYKIYEEKICKFIDFEIRCTDGKIIKAPDACPDILTETDSFISYLLLIFCIVLITITIGFACYLDKSKSNKYYNKLNKTCQADAENIKEEIEFSDVDLNTTDTDIELEIMNK